MSLSHRAYDAFFRRVHGSRLIYNSCWEDPRADRALMGLDSQSRLLMITSAGCNALDYLLDDVAHIDCVDLNPRQNALLEMKLALYAHGDHGLLFQLFGHGQHADFAAIYPSLRPRLSPSAQAIWDKQKKAFSPRGRRSFYFRGASGDVAYGVMTMLRKVKPKVYREIQALLEAQSLDEQRAIYGRVDKRVWTPFLRWWMRQPAILTLLGVPRAQRNLIETQYPGGMNAYVEDKVRYLLTELPIHENYFWRVYLTGSYTTSCCPNYLRPEHFNWLRERIDRVQLHTMSLTDRLKQSPMRYSHYVLLDHQDWLAAHNEAALREEWEQLLAKANGTARVLMRSAALAIDFLPAFVSERLRVDQTQQSYWHQRDRVGTYGSVLAADLSPTPWASAA